MTTLKLIAIFAFLLIPNITLAANHYIRDGASGNGSDWSNAWDTLPTSLTRGDTYYIADGTYTMPRLDDAESGTALIYIKKAIESDHGTATGWSSAYGDGQAVMSKLLIITGYWEINGQTRDEDVWNDGTSYGFKVDYSTGTYGIKVDARDVDAITIKYVNVDGTGRNSGYHDWGIDFIRGGSSSDYIISYNYIHDVDQVLIATGGQDNILIERNYIATNYSTATHHGGGIVDTNSDNYTIRYNIIQDVEGTCIIESHNRDANPWTNDNWEIYGNVIFRSDPAPYAFKDTDKGIICVINQQSATNWRIYNNTAINIKDPMGGVKLDSNADQNHSNIYVYNNLWYDSAQGGLKPGTRCTNCIGDYNYYMETTHTTEANEENYATKDPSIFVNHSGENFRLASGTSTGFSLTSPFNVDMDANSRGGDGTWDRGAFEYGSGFADLIAPSPPTNLLVSDQ